MATTTAKTAMATAKVTAGGSGRDDDRAIVGTATAMVVMVAVS